MSFLIDLLLDLIGWCFPWFNKREDRSIVGESRLDREGRWFGWILLILLVLGLGALAIWFGWDRRG